MARYKMDDGTIVDTHLAAASWNEDTDWDGSNNISRATGSQWDHESLHRSAKGRYYVESISGRSGCLGFARWLTPEEAGRWILHNNHDLPEDLKHLEETLVE